jgi:hypothetical protein
MPFKQEYCKELVKHCAQGHSSKTFAAVVECSLDTLYEWEKKYPEFSEAKKLARQKQEILFERLFIGMSFGKIKGNATAAIWLTKVMCGWTEPVAQIEENKQPLTIDITGNDDDIQGA